MICTAPGTVRVISRMGMPPARIASTASSASAADVARTTGTMPTSRMRSTADTGGSPFHHPFDLGQRGHAGVAGGGHGQRAVSSAALDGPSGAAAGQKTIDQSRGEGVTPTDTVENLEIEA